MLAAEPKPPATGLQPSHICMALIGFLPPLRSASLVNHAAVHQPRFGAVSLGRRVRHWLDATPAGLALDLLSSALSVLVISVYIVRGGGGGGGCTT
jgi:hypothetical protein